MSFAAMSTSAIVRSSGASAIVNITLTSASFSFSMASLRWPFPRCLFASATAFALASAARVSATSFFAATGSASKMAMRAICKARKAMAPSADSFMKSRAASAFCCVVGAGAAGGCWAEAAPASMVVPSNAATIPLESFMAILLFERPVAPAGSAGSRRARVEGIAGPPFRRPFSGIDDFQSGVRLHGLSRRCDAAKSAPNRHCPTRMKLSRQTLVYLALGAAQVAALAGLGWYAERQLALGHTDAAGWRPFTWPFPADRAPQGRAYSGDVHDVYVWLKLGPLKLSQTGDCPEGIATH